MTKKEFLISMFSGDGTVSSARVGFYLTLVPCTGLVVADAIVNKKINVEAFLAVLAAGTGGYGITKASEVSVTNTATTSTAINQTKEEL